MIRMKKGNRVKEVVDNKLVSELKKQGWESLDKAPIPVQTKNKITASAEVIEEVAEADVEEVANQGE